tara:strand:- start:3639 stop:5339 length:1701 start_codon:yes stop_codon:yes gene_type:complete
MAFERLPQLRKPEETKVSARVIDVFYRPQTKPVDQTLGLLAESLERFNPNLQKYIQKKEEVTEKVDTAKAQADYNKNRKDFKTLIEKGEIPEGASPYYVNAYINAELREKARQFNDELYAEYQNSNVKNSLDPNAFGKFYTQYAQQWANTNGLNLYDNVAIAEGFIPFADASRSNLESQHVQGRITTIEDNNKKLLDTETKNIIEDSFEFEDEQIDGVLDGYDIENIDDESKRHLYVALKIKEVSDKLSANGMKNKTINKVIVDSIVAEAIERGDEDLLEILNNVVTDEASGSFLGGTTYAQNEIESATSKILGKREDLERYEAWKSDRNKNKTAISDADAFLDYILQGNGIDVEEFIKEYEREDGTKITSLTTVNGLRSFATSWLSAQDVIDENDQLITSIRKEIYLSPLKSGNIVNQIESAMLTKQISQQTGQALIKEFATATANVDAGYITTNTFKRIEKGVEQYILKGAIDPAPEDVDLLDETLIDLYDFANRLIIDLETNSQKYGNKTAFEKELIFNELVAEYSRKIKLDLQDQVGADLDSNIEEKDKIQKRRSINPFKAN